MCSFLQLSPRSALDSRELQRIDGASLQNRFRPNEFKAVLKSMRCSENNNMLSLKIQKPIYIISSLHLDRCVVWQSEDDFDIVCCVCFNTEFTVAHNLRMSAIGSKKIEENMNGNFHYVDIICLDCSLFEIVNITRERENDSGNDRSSHEAVGGATLTASLYAKLASTLDLKKKILKALVSLLREHRKKL
ncbi:hypothetical protein ACJX0J_037370 [Zea mays]